MYLVFSIFIIIILVGGANTKKKEGLLRYETSLMMTAIAAVVRLAARDDLFHVRPWSQ